MAAGMGMSIAVSVLMLFAAGVTDLFYISALCLFVASLMTWIPLREEQGYAFALTEFAVVSAISLLISRSSIYTYLYIFLFGNYAVVRYFLRTRISDRFLTLLLRLLFLNIMAAALLAIADYVFGYDLMTQLPATSVFIVWGAMQTAFLIFMLLYKVFSLLFDSALRNLLLPRR